MFQSFFDRYLPQLDATMRSIVDHDASMTPIFHTMLAYPLGWVDTAGQPYDHPTGKRVRPVFLLLCAEAAGGDWQQALPAAAAVELLHNFSLIHDDIQDNSEIRHGRPTVWKVWGRADAINAGDALFTLAYTALENLSMRDVPPHILIDIWRVFNHTNLELTRGQYLDMRFERESQVAVDEYIAMILGKSAALLAACAQIGALIGSRDPSVAARYADFALNLGVAFQIRDDILGIWGDPDLTGKSTATDIISRKKSLPVLYGLQHSEDLRQLYARPDFDDAAVAQAVSILDALDAQRYAQQIEGEYYKKSIEALDKAHPTGPAADNLRLFVDALFRRSY